MNLKLEKSINLDGDTVYNKLFQLQTEQDFAKAEQYKAKHENKGAQVKTRMNSLGDIVSVTAIYTA